MKKLLIFLMLVLGSTSILGQAGKKITELSTAGSADDNSLMYIRQGANGDAIRKITVATLRTGMGVLRLTDTASMLTPYINHNDTASMLTNYLLTSEGRNIVRDSLNALRSNSVIGSTLYARLRPDTVQHTANYTVAASDWGKDQHCNKATSIVITIPQNLTDWPVGGVMNFYGMGAGIMVFKKGSGVVFITDSDSIATSRKGQGVSWKKVATNKYIGVGPLTD